MTDNQITRRDGAAGGRPIIVGTKIEVLSVVEMVRDHGLEPRELVMAYEDIKSVEQIDAALAYYDNHPEEMDRLREERDRAVERIREQGGGY